MNKQADGEKTCGTCRNEDTYHCAECENKSDYEQSQADGEYISKSDMIDWLKDIRSKIKPQGFHTASEFEIAENQILNLIQMLQMGAFPTVAIPPDHDGCKDCKYETYPEYYYPCCECKQNYKDMWVRKKIGHWVEMGTNEDGTHNICCGVCGIGKLKSKGHANSEYTNRIGLRYGWWLLAKVGGIDRRK